MELKKELVYHEYVVRESELVRAPYLPEIEFYHLIQTGNVAEIEKFMEISFAVKKGFGTLSQNPLQNLKYHFAITAAMVARFCIEGGMEYTTAYTLSDYYIQKADISQSSEKISLLHRKMCFDYTERMHQLHLKQVNSPAISKCLNYIYTHLHTRITLPVLAEIAGLSEGHLSRQFKKELGMNISHYIQKKKIETAASMLRYTEYSISFISEVLAFPNQSYFTELFKKTYQMTPGQYKKRPPDAVCTTPESPIRILKSR